MNRRGILQLATAVLAMKAVPSSANTRRSVSFLNWDAYIGASTLSDFESDTGISVNYGLFADNFELFAKIRSSPGQLDVIVPSNMLVDFMIQAELLAPIDKSLLSHWNNIDQRSHNPDFDPGRRYSVPYTQGSLLIGYRKSKVQYPPTSLADVFLTDRYHGKIAIPNDSIVAMQLALKALGFSINDWSDGAVSEAERLLISIKPSLVAFATGNEHDLLLSGEADVVIGNDGPIRQVLFDDDDLQIVHPSEGTLIWEDTLCILNDSENIHESHVLIDYLLRGEVAAEIISDIGYSMPNKKAHELLGSSVVLSGSSDRDEYGRFPGMDVLADIEKRWLRIKLS